MLKDQLKARQCRRQFESVLGEASVAKAIEFVQRELKGTLVPVTRRLAELLVDDTSHWIQYRRKSDTGKTIDHRANVFLRSGLIIVFETESDDWFLRTAYFAIDRRACVTRRDAIVNQIRTHFGEPVVGNSEKAFNPRYEYRSPDRQHGYASQTDFVVSDPSHFGITDLDRDGRGMFRVNGIPRES